MNFELSKEQRDFQRVVHDFVAQEVKPLAKEVDETGEFNWRAVRKMGPLGMLGLQVPEAYGGADLDTICATIAIEELGWACGSTALAVSAHNCLGQGPLVDFGSEALKDRMAAPAGHGQGPAGLPDADRTGGRLRPAGWSAHLRRARRRLLGDQRRQDVGHQRQHCRHDHCALPHGRGRGQPQPQPDSDPHRHAGRRDRQGGEEDGAERLAHPRRHL